jgi:serine/threonine protein kinase/WD40 repeat protein
MAADNSAIDPIDPVGPLADEFLDRHRRGEQPAVADYAERYPEHAERIKQLFPMLVAMEAAGAGASLGATIATDPPAAAWNGPHLDRVGGYRLLREVGRGGMGIVYEAEQVALGRHVALKVLPLHAARDGSGLERFRQEAKAAARLHHTNIVPVYEVGQDGDAWFYAMQFIAGQPLDQVLDELRKFRAAGGGIEPPPPGAASAAHSLLAGLAAPPPPPSGPAPSPSSVTLPGNTEPSSVSSDRRAYYRSVARVGVQVAQALDYAHKEGVIHRDVKPSNLLLDADGRVWVTDFGLAKTDGTALTQTGDIVGTVRYMAPERFNGWSDPRSDVYSLGLTLYEMLALRPAFAGSEQMRVMQQVLHEEPPGLRRIDPNLPRDLETVVVKALDKEPSRRYQTAADLGADLQRFLDDRPILARRIGLPERAWRWGKRNPALAATAALTMVALLAVTVVSVCFAAAQARSAEEQKRLSDDLRGALDNSQRLTEKLDVALKETRRHAARSSLDRGRSLMERGHLHEAMLWLARALELAPAEDNDVAHYARASLAALEADSPALHALWQPQHPGPVSVVAFSADGTVVLTGSEATEEAGGEARLWDAATGRPLTAPLPHRGSVTQVAISPDGKTLLTASSPQPGQWEVRLWDAASGQALTDPVPHPGAVTAAVCGPGGKTFLTAGGARPDDPAEARLWRVTGATASPRALGRPGVTALALGGDGKALITCGRNPILNGGELYVYDATTGQVTAGANLPFVPTAAAFAPDGSVWVGGETGEVLSWDPARSNNLRLLASAGVERVRDALAGDVAKYSLTPGPREVRGAVREMALSPAEDLALITSENLQTGRLEARLWDRSRGQWLGLTFSHEAALSRSAFSPDGRRVLTWDHKRPLRVWDLDTDRRWFAALPVPRTAGLGSNTVQYASDGDSLLTVAAGFQQRSVQLWDAGTGMARGEPVHAPGAVFASAASADGRISLFAGVREARAWDNLTGKPAGPPITYDVPPGRIAFAPDGKTAALANAQRLWLVDVTTGRTIDRPFPPPGAPTDLRFSADGKELWLATPATVRRLDVATGREVSPSLPVRGRAFHAVVPAPGGRLLAVLDQTGGALWDTVTGHRHDFSIPHWTARTGIAFSPDGRGLLTADPSGYGAQLWDVVLGRPVGLAVRCPSAFTGGSFRPDGRALAVAGGAGIVRLVRLPDQEASEPEQAVRRVQALTGLELTAAGDVRPLDPGAWQKLVDAAGEEAQPALGWHLRRALDRAEVEHWDAVLWHLDRHLREQPDHWLALAMRARALANLNRFDEAGADLARSFEKGPAATVFAWHLLAAQQAGLNFDGDADPRKPRRAPVAAWFLDRLTERNTRQSASLLVERARARGRAKQWGKAIEDYERAVRLLPDDASLKVELAHAYEQRKNGDKSDKSVH